MTDTTTDETAYHADVAEPLNEQTAAAVHRAIGGLPFAPNPRVHKPARVTGLRPGETGPVTGLDVVLLLTSLAPVLHEYAEEHRALETELAELRRDIAGMRRLLGTDYLVEVFEGARS